MAANQSTLTAWRQLANTVPPEHKQKYRSFTTLGHDHPAPGAKAQTRSNIRSKSSLDAATSAIWKITCRAWRTTQTRGIERTAFRCFEARPEILEALEARVEQAPLATISVLSANTKSPPHFS